MSGKKDFDNLNVSQPEIRVEYKEAVLDEAKMDADPVKEFSKWFNHAIEKEIPLANTMVLATADADARPSARAVMLKGFGEQGFVFYGGTESQKGEDLKANPKAEAVFLWLDLEQQIRIAGHVEPLSREDSKRYFDSRPLDSRIAALASRQSKPLQSRAFLDERFRDLKEKHENGAVPLPEDWGGYRIIPERIEFWQGRLNRLNERVVYEKKDDGRWRRFRLQP